MIPEFQSANHPRSLISGRSWASSSFLKWLLGGSVLWGLFISLAILSRQFSDERELRSKPILALVGVLIFSGALYLLVISWVEKPRSEKVLLLWIMILGAACRLTLFWSTPMLEDDYYRYLWDGAVVSKGINPYRFAPNQALTREPSRDQTLLILNKLAADSGSIASRINHSEIRSIYPPVAQMTFALAHRLRPWSLLGWRLVLFAFDMMTLWLLIVILRSLKLPVLWIAIYWWNPLLIKEIYNSGHMDVIVFPFVLGALLLAIRGSPPWASASLGLAVGAKVWPILLLPIILRPIFSRPKKLFLPLSVFFFLVGVMLFPIAATGLGSDSGFIAYGRSWENNDALFKLILWGSQIFLQGLGIHPGHGQWVTRLFVVGLLAILLIRLNWKRIGNPIDFCTRALFILAALFLLSPTQFPWYYVWLIPFLTLCPRWSLLFLTALLPLYYLRYWFDARQSVGIFDLRVVWLEYLPVFCLLIWEWYIDHRKARDALKELAI